MTSITMKILKWIAALLVGGLTLTVIVRNNGCNIINITRPGQQLKNAEVDPAFTKEGPWSILPVSGKDDKDRQAFFSIAVLTQEDRWVLGKADRLESGSVQQALPAYLLKLEKFSKAQEVVVVGTASQEGELGSEVTRADRRADELLRVIRPLSGEKVLYKLNLGRHEKSESNGDVSDTSYQRRVIIISIDGRDRDMGTRDIKAALYDSLRKTKTYSFNILDYSTFAFAEV